MVTKNILFLIGNGFDLAHGLKTRYYDFLEWYFNKNINLIRTAPHHTYSDDLMTIQSDFSLNEKGYSLDQLNGAISGNFVNIDYKNSLFLNIVKSYSNSNWVDIEYAYFQAILSMYKAYERGNTVALREVAKINKCLDSIKIQLIEYLSTTPTFIPNNKNIEEKFINEGKNVPPERILFLVFNYTKTIEMYLDNLGIRKDQVIYIHGSIYNHDNPIIFGYGDEMNPYYSKMEGLNNNELLRNMKSFSYLKSINLMLLNRFIENGDYTVSIMGHSCGLSDRVLLNSVFCHVNCKGIRIYYHNEKDYDDKIMEISRHFKPEDKGEMRKRIVPYPHSYPLS